MINIFNLFLVLFAASVFLAAANNNLSWFFIICGFLSSAVVSFVAFRLKIVNQNSNFLFLNFGFYRHFLSLFIRSFPKSLFLILRFIAIKPAINPVIYYLPIKKQTGNSLTILIATILLIPGIYCIGVKDGELVIHALDKKYFEEANLDQLYRNLSKINDDRLV